MRRAARRHGAWLGLLIAVSLMFLGGLAGLVAAVIVGAGDEFNPTAILGGGHSLRLGSWSEAGRDSRC